MADAGPFSVGQSVLVPHTDRFYEAKVLKAGKREDGQWHYLIHYIGWNKKWDEWVEASGLQPASDAAALGLLQPAAKKAKSSAGGATAAAAAAAWQRGKASHDGGAAQAAPLLDIELSGALRQQLLDDYSAASDAGRVLPLPRTPTVAAIAARYLAQLKAERAAAAEANPSTAPITAATPNPDADAEDFVAGLVAYFDKALAHCLLYPSERDQARAALGGGALPSALYGGEHLLRLFVKLPELLPQVPTATQEQLVVLRTRLEGLLSYMQDHAGEVFLPTAAYVAPDDAAARPAGTAG